MPPLIYILREFELEEKKREQIKKEVRKKVIDTKMGGGEEESIEKKKKERKINIFLRKEKREWNKKLIFFTRLQLQ